MSGAGIPSALSGALLVSACLGVGACLPVTRPGGENAAAATVSIPPSEAHARFEGRLREAHPDFTLGVVWPDTEAHINVIMDAAVDPDEKFLVSGGLDRTARIWALDSGRLIGVLRIPLEGEHGRIHAVAISPDGRLVAVAGWEGPIFLFRTNDWHLAGTIPNQGSVMSMRYSPDGSRLAVGLWSRNGLRVFETGRYRQVFADRSYGADIYGVAFDRDGHLAVASWDRTVRLYDRDFNVLARRALDLRPHHIAFDPKGEWLAVGLIGRPAVAVLAATNLDLVRELSIPPRDPSDSLGSVGWSADGASVLGCGRYDDAGGWNNVIRWSRDGSLLGEWRLPKNTCNQLAPLPAGALAVVSQDPLVGVFNADGGVRWVRRSPIATLEDQARSMRFSPNASAVQFSWRPDGARLAFDMRKLAFVQPSSGSWRSPQHEHSGFEVQHWFEAVDPTLNGTRLPVDRFEECRALAIDAPRDRLVLGCEWHVYAFNREGRALWRQGGAATRGLYVSEDGALTVVGSADGTFRWIRTDTGVTLVTALFVDEGREWVAWTPSGFFAGSAAGERLLGAQGLHEDGSADSIPMVEFADSMRRPDLVRAALDAVAPR
jgi:WD40 repeat protein